ncbi:MAG: nucleotidyltransferase family protein [Turicibacter sp.]|nr:nucleotidyltransferase family protein [Turicibacter sp.]
MKAIVLSAGYATRMYPLTLSRPKGLLPLGGRPILNYIIEQIETLPNVDEIILVSNHKFYEHYEEWLAMAEYKTPITILNDGSLSEDDRLGAIGDIAFVLKTKNLQTDLVIIAGDNYNTYPLLEQYEFFKEKDSDVVCAMRITNKEDLKRFAVAEIDKNNKLLSLIEKPQNPQSDLAVFATYFYKAETLPLFKDYINEGNSYDAPGYFLQWLYKRKDVYAYIMNGECYDIGTVAAYEELKNRLEQ